MSEVIMGVTNRALDSMEYYKGQRDRLLEAVRALVKEEPRNNYNEECGYCGLQWRVVNNEDVYPHKPECYWLLAQATLAEIEAQIAKEAK